MTVLDVKYSAEFCTTSVRV